jgi:hypothetical protein
MDRSALESQQQAIRTAVLEQYRRLVAREEVAISIQPDATGGV